MEWILENWHLLVEGVALLLAGASIIAKLTPTPKDDELLRQLIDFMSFLKPKDSVGIFKAPLTRTKKE